jgi:hypothetical protein
MKPGFTVMTKNKKNKKKKQHSCSLEKPVLSIPKKGKQVGVKHQEHVGIFYD